MPEHHRKIDEGLWLLIVMTLLMTVMAIHYSTKRGKKAKEPEAVECNDNYCEKKAEGDNLHFH